MNFDRITPERPSDITTKFTDALRTAARGGAPTGYTCPICRQQSSAAPKLWEHAKRAHPDSPDVKGSTEAVEARDLFLAKVRQNKASQAPARRSVSKPPSNEKDVAKKDSPERLRPTSPERPLSAPGYGQVQGEWIDDTEKLTIHQNRQGQHQARQPERSLAANNKGIPRKTSLDALTRKRGAEDEIRSPDPLLGSPAAQSTTTRGHHAKTASGGFLITRDQELSNQGNQTSDLEYRRNIHGATTPLYDPNTDNPNTGKAFHRDRHQNPTSITPRRLNLPKDHVSRNRKPSLLQRNRRPQTFKARPEKSMSNEPDSTIVDEAERPSRPLSGGDSSPVEEAPEGIEVEPEMLLQPDTRPISHEQLVVEVKGIYAGLVMVEAKCIDIDERQSAAAQEKDPTKRVNLKNDQWQSLIALHKQLLHEHHDFFLASQHPSASPALSRLAAKYSMPARMWRHGIHAFLEVLRHRLPESLEHMLAFIYIAYSMMALLYETVSTFEDTWIECLGDLGRYRMAIEDDEPKDREVWSNVARFWYNKAADNSPNIGRLYHHLAILARPYTLEQLSLYARSLTCITPFESAKSSIMTLFNPILNGKESATRRTLSFETIFIKAHGILFTKSSADPSDRFNDVMKELEANDLFDNYIFKVAARFREFGVFAAIANIAAIFEYGIAKHGAPKPVMRLAIESYEFANQGEVLHAGSLNTSTFLSNIQTSHFRKTESVNRSSSFSGFSTEAVALASRIAFSTLRIALRRLEDPNIYPLVHVYLVFLRTLVNIEQAMKYIEAYVPWKEICSFLDSLSTTSRAVDLSLRSQSFPEPEEGPVRPLPEDFTLRGQLYTQSYFPDGWFADAMIDDNERSLDLPSMAEPRADRLYWLGHCIASAEKWIRFDKDAKCFSPTVYASKIRESSVSVSGSDHTQFETPMASDSTDEDSAMEDAESIADTPRTASIAPSDSQIASVQSTRASTPTENRVRDLIAGPDTLKAIENDGVADDVTMKDVGAKKEPVTSATGKFDNMNDAPWPSGTAIIPGSSPLKARKRGLDFATDTEQREGLLYLGDPDV